MNYECYSRSQLEQYMLGKLSHELCDQIAQHLGDCDVCEDTVIGLDRTVDTLIDVLHDPGGPRSESGSDNLQNDEQGQLAGFFDHQQIEALPEFQAAVDAVRSQIFSHGSVEIPPPVPGQIGLRIGDYELEEQIGIGGMGAVFRARHTRLEKQVAFKILPERKMQNGDAISRFSREMKIIGQMDHPTMVSATDAGVVDGTHYLAMELIAGMDLSRVVRLYGPLAPADACELIRQAALGLQYAHEQNVIHRDVKPSNLMLTRTGNLKILDLGLATLGGLHGTVDELTTVGQLMGTLDYMAPEQCGEQGIDGRTDIYGLGATLYKLLTGSAPYSNPAADTPLKKLKAMAVEPPTPILDRRNDLSPAIAEVVERALQRDPADRFQSADEFAAAIEPFCEHHEIDKLVIRAEHLAKQNLVAETTASPSIPNLLGAIKPGRAASPRKKIMQPRQRSGWRGWIMAACLLALAGFLGFSGITIYLDTIAGQLVIESELEEAISVSIVQDEKPTKEIQIEHGSKSTKLRAGKYRIEIKGDANDLVVKNGTFELKKGDIVVARITQQKSGSAPVTPGKVSGGIIAGASPGQAKQSESTADALQLIDLENQVEIARLELQREEVEYQRVQGMFQRASTNKSSLDVAKTELAIAMKQFETAQAKLQAVRAGHQAQISSQSSNRKNSQAARSSTPVSSLLIVDLEADCELARLRMETADERMSRLRDGTAEKEQVTVDRKKAEIEFDRAVAKLALAKQQLANQQQNERVDLELQRSTARNDLANARDQLERSKKLFERQFITSSQLKNDESEVLKLEQQLASIEQQLKRFEGSKTSLVGPGPDSKRSVADQQKSDLPTYRGLTLEDYVVNAIAGNPPQPLSNFLRPIEILVKKSAQAELEALLNRVLPKYEKELSLSRQQTIILVLSCLCQSANTRQTLLDYIQRFISQQESDPWEAARFIEPLAKDHFEQVQQYLLDAYNDATPRFKSAAIAWLLKDGFDDSRAASRTGVIPYGKVNKAISEQWRSRLLADTRSEDEMLAYLACRALAWHWSKDERVLEQFGRLLSSKLKPVRLAAIDTLVFSRSRHPDLVKTVIGSVEDDGESPVRLIRLLELYPTDPNLINAIKEYLSDPTAGYDKSQETDPWQHRKVLISGMTRRAGRITEQLLPLLEQELEQANDKSVLTTTWETIAAIKNTPVPPLAEGRTFEQWLARLQRQDLSPEEKTKCLRMTDGLASSFEPQVVLAIARSFRGSEFPLDRRQYEEPIVTLMAMFGSDNKKQSLILALDYLPEEDALFGMFLIAKVRLVSSSDAYDPIRKFLRNYINAEDAVVRRRALYLAARYQDIDRKSKTVWPISEVLDSEEPIELKLSLLDAPRYRNGEPISLEYRFEDIDDPKIVSTILGLAAKKEKERQVLLFDLRYFIVDQLVANRDYLSKRQPPMQLDLWNGPIKEKADSEDFELTIFDQIVAILDSMNEQSLKSFFESERSSNISYGLIPQEELRKALDVLEDRLPETEGVTRRRLERVLQQFQSKTD